MPEDLSLTIHGYRVIVRPAQVSELIDLRHRELRCGLPRQAAVFADDEAPTSRHYGAFLNDNSICCASFHQKDWKSQPAWQLRGMATDKNHIGQGLGRAVLTYALSTLTAESPIHQFWCNARLIAVPFYQKLGWEIASEQFEIATAGPHYRMVRLKSPFPPTPPVITTTRSTEKR